MDHIRLNSQQLRNVAAFIQQRGFREQLVIVEILSHFAGKVEEKLTLYPGLSLDEAMRETYDDYGSIGFYPLFTAYEAAIKKKYKELYALNRRKVFRGFFSLVFIAAASFYFYKAYIWSNTHFYNHEYGVNGVGFLAGLFCLVSLFWLPRSVPREYRHNPIVKTIVGRDVVAVAFLAAMIGKSFHSPGRFGIEVDAVLVTVCLLYFLARQLAVYATLKKGGEDSKKGYLYLQTL